MMGVNLRADVAPLLSPDELARHPWSFRCPVQGCYYGVCAPTQEDAERERFTHGCPRTGGPMGTGHSLIYRAWEQLDADVDEIVRLGVATQPNVLEVVDVAAREALMRKKASARGKAEILALFMTPHFRTADEVSEEAGRRLAARQSGAFYQTPGATF